MSLTLRRNSFPAALLLASLAASLLSAQANQQHAADKRRGFVQETYSIFQKWLDEDVRYIITDQERADFLKLTTARQRDDFVEAFWERRNPTPGSTENPFKEEHYRRLAYANQHFAEGIPGWRTHRGRVYIVYGPPNKIETHQRGGAMGDPPDRGEYAYEDWYYSYIEGLGRDVTIEFVDTCSCGEYHLTRDPFDKSHPKERE
jgi:GWxTD domain-containing protein